MPDIDPIKVMRNPETLAAYRRWRREALGRAAPWWGVAVAVLLAEIGLVLYGLYGVTVLSRGSLRELSLASSGLTLVFGVCFAIGGLQAWRYQRAHPLELP